jgi:hypothetical protein
MEPALILLGIIVAQVLCLNYISIGKNPAVLSWSVLILPLLLLRGSLLRPVSEIVYSIEEEKQLEQKLADLGYID